MCSGASIATPLLKLLRLSPMIRLLPLLRALTGPEEVMLLREGTFFTRLEPSCSGGAERAEYESDKPETSEETLP